MRVRIKLASPCVKHGVYTYHHVASPGLGVSRISTKLNKYNCILHIDLSMVSLSANTVHPGEQSCVTTGMAECSPFKPENNHGRQLIIQCASLSRMIPQEYLVGCGCGTRHTGDKHIKLMGYWSREIKISLFAVW